jgi:catechol 2,3-dioxygenase-like lactoylglutathione lyase family enzyme
MKLMPIVYVTDMARSVAFYEGLGLTAKTKGRSGMWFELTLGDAVLALHKADYVPAQKGQRMELSFVSSEALETLIARWQQNGIESDGIVDEAFGRSCRVTDPDGLMIQINEHEEELYT